MEDDFLQKLKAGDRSALGELHRRWKLVDVNLRNDKCLNYQMDEVLKSL